MIVVQAPGMPPTMFEGGFTIGRRGGRGTGCKLLVDDDYASSPHARITEQGGCWYVEDLGSTNGTWFHDGGTLDLRNRIYGPVPLTRGDKIRIGHTVLTVVPV